MAKETGIAWTDHTGNLWWGCTKVHAGCDNCYAERVDMRQQGGPGTHWGNDKPRRAIKSFFPDMAAFQRSAAKDGTVRRVFIGSMMDIFEKPMPLVDAKGKKIMLDDMDEVGMSTDDLRQTFFGNISRGEYPNLLFLMLTKRPGNINKYIPDAWKETPPENVMFGTSPVDQATADKLIPQLMGVKGRRFLSIEPMLGKMTLMIPDPGTVKDMSGYTPAQIDWVIVGGESGPKARPMHPDWVENIRLECDLLKVPFFFKQWGEWLPIDKPHDYPGSPPKMGKNERYLNASGGMGFHGVEVWRMRNIGKQFAGHLYKGNEYFNFPPINQKINS